MKIIEKKIDQIKYSRMLTPVSLFVCLQYFYGSSMIFLHMHVLWLDYETIYECSHC